MTTAGRRAVDLGSILATIALVTPVALVIVAESAWIAVIGGLVQLFTLRDAILGVPTIVPFVLAGTIAARVLGPRLGGRWPIVALGLVAAAAAVGWALSDEARAALPANGVGAALAAHPGGLIAGLAMLRGFAHARLPLADETVSNLMAIGIPAVALAALVGGLIAEPFRSRFLADALADAILFVGAAAVALSLARLDAVGADGGFDWRRNPRWLLMTIAAVVFAVSLAMPLAGVAGFVVPSLISMAMFPLFVVGLVTGFDQVIRRLAALGAFAVVVILILIAFFGREGEIKPPTETDAATLPPQSTPADQIVQIGLGGVLLVGAIAGVLILVALWMRRTPFVEPAVAETRTIDRGSDADGPHRRRRRFGRTSEPRTAVEAYVALVDALDRHDGVRRDVAETPARHAARMRASGAASPLSLELLAADYALVRYGGGRLPASEDHRAVGRWRVLRHALVGSPRRVVGAAVADVAVPQAEIDGTDGTRTGLRTGG